MWRLTIILGLALLVSGCIFTRERFIPVKYYDIGNPDNTKYASTSLRVGAFTVTGPYRQEMVFRTEKNELVKDQYSRWVQAPDDMLRRYLKIAFPDTSGKKEYAVTGNILTFEADMNTREAVLVIEYRITSASSVESVLLERTFTSRKKFEGNSPEVLAGAMATAVADFADSMCKELKDLSVKQK